MKLKGRMLALTMAFMLIISSMGSFALAESVSIQVHTNRDSNGGVTITANFSGFPADAENAYSTLEGGGKTLGPVALTVNSEGQARLEKTFNMPAGSYTITAYLGKEPCGSTSFTVAETTSETELSQNGGEDLADGDGGIMTMSATNASPTIEAEARVEDGKLFIDMTIAGLPETVAVINATIDKGTGGDRYTDVKTDNGAFKTTFTASSVTPGDYKVTAQIKYTDASQEEPDASLSKTATFAPIAPKITSASTYTEGVDYTLTWEDNAQYDGASISYIVAYWGIPADETEEKWVELDVVSGKQYKLSADALAQYGDRYAVRAVATVSGEQILGRFDNITLTPAAAPQATIEVADATLNSESKATVTAVVTVPEGATLEGVWFKNDSLSVNAQGTPVDGEANKFTFEATQPSDDYYVAVRLKENPEAIKKSFKVNAYVPEATVKITAKAFGDAVSVTFADLPATATQVCINVKSADGNHKQHFDVSNGSPTKFTTTDAAVNALLKTPGEYTITVSYEDGGTWYYPESGNNVKVTVPLQAPKFASSVGTYTPGTSYLLSWTDDATYASGVNVTYAIAMLLTGDDPSSADADWKVIATDLSDKSYTIPASYFDAAGTHTFGVRAVWGDEMSDIAFITLSNSGSPRFVKAPETLLYPDDTGAYVISARIEGLDGTEKSVSMYADDNLVASADINEGTAEIDRRPLSESSAANPSATLKFYYADDGSGDPIDSLTTTVKLAPATPAITSGMEVSHTAGKDLTITWNAVAGATDYVVKINGVEDQYPTSASVTIPGNRFEDGKSYSITVEARKGTGNDAIVGKPATITVAVGTQPLAAGNFSVQEAVVDASGNATIRILASELDSRVTSIRMTYGVASQEYTDLTSPMELKLTDASAGKITLAVVQKTADPALMRASSIEVTLVAETSLPRFSLSTNAVSMSVEGAKFNVTVYNLPEDAQRLCVNIGGEKIDSILVTDALRADDGSITLEIGGSEYPFSKLSEPGTHSVRLTYQTASGSWPQIGEPGSLTVKPATPVLSSAEDVVTEGEDYTLAWADDVPNAYGVNYEYAFFDSEANEYGAWTATVDKTVSIPAASFPSKDSFVIGVRAVSNGVYSDIASVQVSIQGLTVTVTPETAYYTGSPLVLAVTVKGIPQAYRGETAQLYYTGKQSPVATADIAEDGSVAFIVTTSDAVGVYPFEVKVDSTTIATGNIKIGPGAPTIMNADSMNITAGTSVTIMFSEVAGATGYRLEMTGGGKSYTMSTPAASTRQFLLDSSKFANNTTYSVSVCAYVVVNGVYVYGKPDTVSIIVGEGGGDVEDGEQVSGDYTFTVSGINATITGYTGTQSSITLPMQLNGHIVTAIGDGAFQNNTTVTSVTIPDSVTTIGANAFEGSDLLKVSGMKNVTSMGSYAFANTDISAFTIPSGLVGLPEGALMNTKITGISIPTTLVSIGAKAFAGCTQLTYYAGADGKSTNYRLQSIGSGAFSGCTKLQSIYIPSSVTSISSDFVDGCTSLSKFEVHESNQNFRSFNDVLFTRSYSTTLLRFPPAKNVTSLNLSNFSSGSGGATIVSIASGAFANTQYLQSVTLPSTISSISANAFQNSSITSISIPTSVTSIGTGAFQGSNLASVIIPASVKTISNRAFQSCSNLTTVTINSGATHINPYAFYNCSNLKTVSIPTTVTYIGDYAFAKCSSLVDITIPDSVTTIATGAFSDANRNLRIRCVENSAAHIYAKENGISVYLEDFVPRLSTDLLTSQSLQTTHREGLGPTFKIFSNTDWTVDTTDAWLTVYNQGTDSTGSSALRTLSGSGNATVGIKVTQNSSSQARSAQLKIIWRDQNNLQQLITINVYQEGRSESIDTQIVVNAGAPYLQKAELGTNYLYNIPAGTAVSNLCSNLNDGLGRFQVTDRSGNTVGSSSTVATGYTLTMLNEEGQEVDRAVISVAGDVNRDGRISISDVNMAINLFLGSEVARTEQWLSANVNLDDRLSVSDVNAIINLYLG